MSRDLVKHNAAAAAVRLVEDQMKLGLGSGSTAAIFISLLAKRVSSEGLRLECVATSLESERIATREGIHVTTLDSTGQLDLTIDGADEIDPSLNMIKGGGGAHLREKVVAWASTRLLIIADESKQVATLGKFPLPVEVFQFACRPVADEIHSWGCSPELRTKSSGEPFVTDEGNYILDCPFGSIADPAALARRLEALPGVAAHGLFIGMAEMAIIGSENGAATITRPAT